MYNTLFSNFKIQNLAKKRKFKNGNINYPSTRRMQTS